MPTVVRHNWYNSLMFRGRLIGIYISRQKAVPLRPLRQVQAVPGRGLEGDRYYYRAGTFSKKNTPDREVTFIEEEALKSLRAKGGPRLRPEQSRRNLLTRGVPLNHLVGRNFRVGKALFQGLKLCEPCGHLEKLSVPGAKKGLIHRGGLRARILHGGTLRIGDTIRPARPVA